MITGKEVEHVAKLARFGLAPKEVEKFKNELSAILDYMEKLKEVDVSKTEPTRYASFKGNVMRSDKAARSEGSIRLKLLEMAPGIKQGYLKVRSILK